MAKTLQEKLIFTIGDLVVVPDATANDAWTHSFEGQIKAFKIDTDGLELCTVEDQDGDCWDVETNRLDFPD